KLGFAYVCFLALVVCVLILSHQRYLMEKIADLNQPKKIVFYVFDMPDFETLDPMVKRNAINIAVQAYKDHFGVDLEWWELREKRVPNVLRKEFSKPWTKDREKLSYWQGLIQKNFFSAWRDDPYGELPVVI